MTGSPVLLDHTMWAAVETCMVHACRELGWTLHAVAVRSNHVHVVVSPIDTTPGKAMGVLKARATKALNAFGRRERWWTRDGSKRILHSERALIAAVQYVNHQDDSWGKDV